MESITSLLPLFSGAVMLVGVWIIFRTVMRGLKRDESDDKDTSTIKELAKGFLLTVVGLVCTLLLTGYVQLWTNPWEMIYPIGIVAIVAALVGMLISGRMQEKIEKINIHPLEIALTEDTQAKEAYKDSLQPLLRPIARKKAAAELVVMSSALIIVSYVLLVLLPYSGFNPWIGIIGAIGITLIIGWLAIDAD